jgi:exosome complex component CSL4
MSSTHSIAIPGQLLGPASKYTPGPGTHIHESNLYSSLLGVVHISQNKPQGPAKRLTKITAAPPLELPTISVSRSGDSEKREVLPGVNDLVLSRVIRITPRQAVVSILVCGDSVLEAEWQGLIRVQDVRATEKDRVKIYESFKPGDIVRAEVVRRLLSATKLGLLKSLTNFYCRYHWVTRPTTTSRQRGMNWV